MLDQIKNEQSAVMPDKTLNTILTNALWTVREHAERGLLDGALERMSPDHISQLRDALWLRGQEFVLAIDEPVDLTETMSDEQIQKLTAAAVTAAVARGGFAGRLVECDPAESIDLASSMEAWEMKNLTESCENSL